MTGTELLLAVVPVVGWPHMAVSGASYLVTVDIRLRHSDQSWTFARESYAFGCILDGGPHFTVAADGPAQVVLHRSGTTNGPARFVVRASSKLSEPTTLWLTLVTPGGITLPTLRLDVRPVHQPTLPKPSTDVAPHRMTIALTPHALAPDEMVVEAWSQSVKYGWIRLPDRLVRGSREATEVVADLVRHEEAAAGAPMTIEFILPNGLLSLPVDQWPIEGTPLGVRHAVVVRSLDRLLQDERRSAWQQRMTRFPLDRPGVDALLLDPTMKVDHMTARDDAFASCLPPDPHRAISGRGSPLEAMLDAGMPIMLWPRKQSLATTFGAAIVRLLTDHTLIQLPSLALELRRNAFESGSPPDHLGSHLTLLFDTNSLPILRQ